MSEELENSLQQAVETYLNERLHAIQTQVEHLQSELNDAISRLNEASQTQPLQGTTLSAAIFAHLQTARGQRLSGATFSTGGTSDAGAIKRAVADIEEQQNQTEILKALLRGSGHFAERVALFVVKNDQVIGWRMSSAADPANSLPIGGVSLPLSSQTNLTRSIHSHGVVSGSARTNPEDDLLLDQLGGSAEVAAAIPLVVRGKVVAALYADSVSNDASAINVEALEILTRVAAMTVNIASIHKTATTPKREEAPPPAKEAASPAEATHTYTPQVESQVPESDSAAVAEPEAAPTIKAHAEEVTEPARAELPAAPQLVEAPATESAPTATASESTEVSSVEAGAPAVPPVQAEPQPVAAQAQPETSPAIASPEFASSYSAPLGSARRYGVTEPELPIEVGEEERRLHNDARRFARLLVSEIKLYNENKVKEGRSNADLYDRLREDIDRSRQMYDKRVSPPVAARHDYFHQELVNLLAEGDPAKLGQSYPGAALTA